MKYKFKAGDKIRIKDCYAVRRWDEGDEAVNKILILTHNEARWINDCEEFTLCNNKYCINFTAEMIELVTAVQKEIKVYGIVKFTKEYYK